MGDRLVIMNAGHVEQVGTPNDIYDAPATRFVGEFIGSPPMSFLEGVVREGGRVDVAGGRALPFDPGRFAVQPGQPIHLGLRAEQMQVQPSLDEASPVVTVDFFEELGSGRLLHLDLDGHPLVAHVGKHVDHAHGTPLRLTAEPSQVHLYDPTSGQRLDGRIAALRAA